MHPEDINIRVKRLSGLSELFSYAHLLNSTVKFVLKHNMAAMVVTASRCSFILAACLLALLGQSPSVATASLTQEEEDGSSSTRHGRHRHARHQQQINQDFALYLLKALAPRHDCSKSKSMVSSHTSRQLPWNFEHFV